MERGGWVRGVWLGTQIALDGKFPTAGCTTRLEAMTPAEKVMLNANGAGHATISRSFHNYAVACNGFDASLPDEEARHTSHAFRPNRQEGFLDSPLRLFLFLYRVCRCIQFAFRE